MLKMPKFTDVRIASVVRWWAVSAVYFFIGWGTRLGQQSTVIDFIFFLSMSIGIFDMLVVNPVISRMFNTSISYKRRVKEQSLMKRVRTRLLYFLRVLVTVIMVVLIYQMVNITAIVLFKLDPETVFLPGEPIMFGIFYMLVYVAIERLIISVKKRMEEVD